jgi:hypothetical protein
LIATPSALWFLGPASRKFGQGQRKNGVGDILSRKSIGKSYSRKSSIVHVLLLRVELQCEGVGAADHHVAHHVLKLRIVVPGRVPQALEDRLPLLQSEGHHVALAAQNHVDARNTVCDPAADKCPPTVPTSLLLLVT